MFFLTLAYRINLVVRLKKTYLLQRPCILIRKIAFTKCDQRYGSSRHLADEKIAFVSCRIPPRVTGHSRNEMEFVFFRRNAAHFRDLKRDRYTGKDWWKKEEKEASVR